MSDEIEGNSIRHGKILGGDVPLTARRIYGNRAALKC